MEVMLLFLVFLIMPCSNNAQCSTTNTTFQKNHRILLDLLIKNTPLHDGFYNSSVGNKPNQVYGVSQCKANISFVNCASCLNSSLGSKDGCLEFPETETLASLCSTKISNKNIIGVWTNFSTVTFEDNGLDDPLAFSKGFSMMYELASSVPYQPLMFQATEVNVGAEGKRYGLSQCGRDLSKLDCRNCLEDRLESYRSYVENRTGWEIRGTSCSMWYSNVSDVYKDRDMAVVRGSPPTPPSEPQFPPGTTTVTSGTQRYHGGIITGTNIIRSTSFMILLLLTTQVLNLS